MTNTDALADLRARIDAIESSYESFLGYAARGTDGRSEQKAETGIRPALAAAIAGIDGLAASAKAAAAGRDEASAWIDVIAEDSRKSLAALRMVQAQEAISSQLIDNLNASIHLRALLTDLFVIDEALKAAPAT